MSVLAIPWGIAPNAPKEYLMSGCEFRRDKCFFCARLAQFVKNVVLYIKQYLGVPMILSVLGRADSLSILSLPFYVSRVSAGFPSPTTDYIETTLDLNELCIKHPAATS